METSEKVPILAWIEREGDTTIPPFTIPPMRVYALPHKFVYSGLVAKYQNSAKTLVMT